MKKQKCMKRYVYIICLLLCVCGLCRAQKPFQPDSLCLLSYRTTTDTINLYKAFIENQKRIETEEQEFDNPYPLSEKDLLIALPLIKQGLWQYQYKDLSDAEFRIKVKQYFGVDICDTKSVSPLAIRTKVHPEYTTLFIEKMDGDIETLHRMEYDLPFYTHNIFISHKYHLIAEMPLLKDIITVTGENEYKVQFRYENVVHRNKYLFNDDWESLCWLKANESGFLKFLNMKN